MYTDVITARRALKEDMKAPHMVPLWESLYTLMPKQPSPGYDAALRRFDDIEPLLRRAGELILAAEAVLRVLILEDPSLPGSASITSLLYARPQLILPHGVASAHCHTQPALCLIVRNPGAYMAVDGERTSMFPSDFILMPSWTRQDHCSLGIDGVAKSVVWLDGFDITITRFFSGGFAENYDAAMPPIACPKGRSLAAYGYSMASVWQLHQCTNSPIFNYPYIHSREALAACVACRRSFFGSAPPR